MALNKLYARLAEELGADAGSYADVYHQLKNRPQSFMLIDSPKLLPDTSAWPRQVREEYDVALRNAGMGACVRVALTEVPSASGPADALALAGATLNDLWTAVARDPAMRDFVTRAAKQLEEIIAATAPDVEVKHPTIRPPDPPQ